MLVEINDITKIYGHQGSNQVKALENISFSLDKGDFIAMCGPSGSGKTTLLTIMAGLHHPTSGKVAVDNISIYDQLDSEGLARFRSEYIGFVFQSFCLIPYLSARENIMLPLAAVDVSKKEKRERAQKVLNRVGLADRGNHLPGQLSGGQRQRVAIARALVNQPLLIYADEPTGNLDSKTRDEILELFDSLREEGHTVIMVTHDPDNIMKATRVIKIRDGKLCA
ncbi:MAG: ABC transporter ATP-binding protein [Candidatus Omnitrophota bacterium]